MSLQGLGTTEGDPIRVTVIRALPPFFGTPGGEIPLQPAQLSYAVAEGAVEVPGAPVATAGTDFVPVSGTFDFAAADTTKLLETQTVEDHVPEPAEQLRLAFPRQVGDIEPPRVTSIGVEINDDDPPAASPRLAGRRTQRVLRQREVRLKATPNAYGKLRATGAITLPRSTAARSIALKRVTKSVVAGRPVALRLTVRRRDMRTLRRILRQRPSLSAKVTVRLVDLAGGSATSTRRIKLVR